MPSERTRSYVMSPDAIRIIDDASKATQVSRSRIISAIVEEWEAMKAYIELDDGRHAHFMTWRAEHDDPEAASRDVPF